MYGNFLEANGGRDELPRAFRLSFTRSQTQTAAPRAGRVLTRTRRRPARVHYVLPEHFKILLGPQHASSARRDLHHLNPAVRCVSAIPGLFRRIMPHALRAIVSASARGPNARSAMLEDTSIEVSLSASVVLKVNFPMQAQQCAPCVLWALPQTLKNHL